jgi:hypothetical protein
MKVLRISLDICETVSRDMFTTRISRRFFPCGMGYEIRSYDFTPMASSDLVA